MRIHRLVQDPMKRGLSAADRADRQQAVDALVKERAAALEKTTRWTEARWELEPLTALAAVWDETNHDDAAWLTNRAGQRWDNSRIGHRPSR